LGWVIPPPPSTFVGWRRMVHIFFYSFFVWSLGGGGVEIQTFRTELRFCWDVTTDPADEGALGLHSPDVTVHIPAQFIP